MEGHVIVCGFGHLGQSIVQLLLSLNETVVVITEEVRRTAAVSLDAPGLRVIRADARDRAALEEACVTTARSVIAAADDDLTNIEIALDIARLAPSVPVVVRLFDQNLARMLEKSFDVRRALAMSAIAAPIFASAALDEPLFARFRLGETSYVVAERKASSATRAPIRESDGPDEEQVPLTLGHEQAGPADALLTSEDRWRRLSRQGARAEPPRAIRNLAAALHWPLRMWRGAPLAMRITFGLLVLLTAVSVLVFSVGLQLAPLAAFYFMVTTITTTGYGDITPVHANAPLKLYACFVMLLGSATTALFYSFFTDFIVAERFRRITQSPDVHERDHVIVVGLGRVGYRIVDALRRLNIPTVGIDVNPAAPFVSEVRALAPVLIGDGRLRGALAKAGISRARALLATTGNDAINLEVALAAREEAKDVRVVSRLFDPAFASKVQGILPIEVALSASRVAAPSFVASALFSHVLAAFVRGPDFVVVTEEEAPVAWAGRLAHEVSREDRVQLAFHWTGTAYTPVPKDARLRPRTRYVLVRRRDVVRELAATSTLAAR